MQDTKKYTKKLTDRGIFLSAIITLTIVFVIVEFFAFALLNLKEYSEMQANTNQVIVYLNDLDEEAKNNISQKIIELPGVSSLRYESKEIALKVAAKELGVAIDESENPLNDAFFVYLNKNVKLDQLKTSLLNMPEISAVDFRTKALEKNINFSKGIDSLSIKFAGVSTIICLFMIYNIVSFSIKTRKKEIHEFLEEGVKPKTLKKTFFIESVAVIFLSTIISFGLYQLIRQLLVKNIKQILPSYATTVSIFEEAGIAVVLFVTAIIISAIISFFAMNRYFKIKTLEKIIVEEKKESKEEDIENEEIGEEDENNWEV